MKLDNINMGTIWTMLVGTAIAITYMFTTFVTTSDFEQYIIEGMYDKYYALEDRLDEELEADDEDDVRRIERDMARLKSKICAIEPEWEECD